MDEEPIRIPVTDVFDLHTVPAREVKLVVENYLEEAHRMGGRRGKHFIGNGWRATQRNDRHLRRRKASSHQRSGSESRRGVNAVRKFRLRVFSEVPLGRKLQKAPDIGGNQLRE